MRRVQSYHNEPSAQLSGAYIYIYVYQATDTMTYPLLSQMSIISLSQTFLHSHCRNTIDISTVFMLVFWLFQFSTGSLAWGLCLLSSNNDLFFFLCEYNICSLD